MGEHELIEALLLVAAAILAATLITKGTRHIGLPPAVGFMLFGVGLRVLDARLGLVSSESAGLLALLGELGVAALLFRVGLESDLGGLLAQLPRALGVWISNVALSAALGFAVAWWAGLGLVPSCFVGVALSATSIGLSVAVWRDAGRLDSPLGALLVDVAELDDLSAVLLTALLLVAAPALVAGDLAGADLAVPFAVMAGKISLFAAGCWLFSRYLEQPLTRTFIHDDRDRATTGVSYLVGVAFAVSALAGALGFSVAVGALFAGLMFSRDPEAVRTEHSFEPIHALFTPFFFLDIGFAVDFDAITGAVPLGLLLLVPAVLGKLLGVGLVLAPREGWRAGALMGVSMAPRAEIALVVARLGTRLGDWAVPDHLYGALVLVCTITAIAAPVVLHAMFRAWPSSIPGTHRTGAAE